MSSRSVRVRVRLLLSISRPVRALLQLANDVGESLSRLIVGAELDRPDRFFDHIGVTGRLAGDLGCAHDFLGAGGGPSTTTEPCGS
ncbi:MAG: hypothetical protein ACC683_13480, partial [Acidimicrobiia bacterium]